MRGRPHSTPLLSLSSSSPGTPSGNSATQSAQQALVGAWAAACQTATYLHVLLRASAFSQHMHDRSVKSNTVSAMLAFVRAQADDPQQLYSLLSRLGKALQGE